MADPSLTSPFRTSMPTSHRSRPKGASTEDGVPLASIAAGPRAWPRSWSNVFSRRYVEDCSSSLGPHRGGHGCRPRPTRAHLLQPSYVRGKGARCSGWIESPPMSPNDAAGRVGLAALLWLVHCVSVPARDRPGVVESVDLLVPMTPTTGAHSRDDPDRLRTSLRALRCVCVTRGAHNGQELAREC